MASDDDSTENGKSVSLTSLDGRLERIQADLRDLVKERRELSILLMDITRFVQKRQDHSPDLRGGYAGLYQMYSSLYQSYAGAQGRIDRLERRIGAIEKHLGMEPGP